MALGELVSFASTNGVSLDGILYRGGEVATVIHVHGSLGNFYSAAFLRPMADIYVEHGINFLSFNLSGHDGIAEGERNGVFEYVGGSVVEFGECVYDIEGAVEFVASFSERVLLQGHSLGCDRVLHFLIETRSPHDFILLGPCDSRELHSQWIFPETVDAQAARLRRNTGSGQEIALLPSSEYGLRGGEGWDYSIPVSQRTLLSIIDGPVFRLIRFSGEGATYHIDGDCLVWVGGNDKLQTAPASTVFEYFGSRVKTLQTMFTAAGDHMLEGCEKDVAHGIARWIRAR